MRTPIGAPRSDRPWPGAGAGGNGGPGTRRRRWLRAALATVTAVTVVACVAVATLVLAAPDVGDARVRVDALLAEHGGRHVQLGRNAKLSRSIVAVEDHRYLDHEGIDVLAFARIGLRSLTDPGSDPGGSTIAIQLAKLLYTGAPARDPATALTQLGAALSLERSYTKDELLDLYLSAAYYGGGQYGADRASRHYTRHEPAALTWGEASMLAGLVQAPSRYARDLDAARRRQRHVLDRLVATGVLTPADADAAYAEPLRRFTSLAGSG